MSSQIIKEKIPEEILLDFLDTNAIKQSNYYILDINTYKKSVLLDNINAFLEKLKPYYFKSKLFYLERKMTYNYLSTIIRQICKKNKISFTSKINYIGSEYNIVYYIYV